MNILIIGNGFDLAHGLPTKYTNFLEWIEAINWIIKTENMKEDYFWREIGEHVKTSEMVPYIYDIWKIKYSSEESINKYLDEILMLIDNNILIEYFLTSENYVSENWIDFEFEISQIIQVLDILKENDNKKSVQITKRQQKVIDNILKLSGEKNKNYLKQAVVIGLEILKMGTSITFGNNELEINHESEIDIKSIYSRLESDLDSLIRLLEIYLTDLVGKISYHRISPDIHLLHIDKVLSFNYTGTYADCYRVTGDLAFDYVHGKADISNTKDTNDMVLGIDEYLPVDRRDKDVDFIAFKKYYQRIYKQTGCEYKNWIEQIRSVVSKKHYLYILGHSLDVTDRDILREFILNDNVYTTIYYHNKQELGKKIANLVKVIGQDELIRRTGGSTKTIIFKLQKEMVEI